MALKNAMRSKVNFNLRNPFISNKQSDINIIDVKIWLYNKQYEKFGGIRKNLADILYFTINLTNSGAWYFLKSCLLTKYIIFNRNKTLA